MPGKSHGQRSLAGYSPWGRKEKFEKKSDKDIDADTAFHLYDTFGFPIELTLELANEKGLNVDIEGFNKKFKEHQELSRTASVGKFKGGLAGNSEIETKYHREYRRIWVRLSWFLNLPYLLRF